MNARDADPPKARVLQWLPLSHHRADGHDRCLMVPAGAERRLALCARCTGLYPTLALALVAQHLLGLGPLVGPLDTVVTLALSAPGLLDWGLGRLRVRGSNAMRLCTGALLGLGLGRGLYLYFRDPLSDVFWIQLALLLFGALAFELVRALRLDS